MTITLVSYMQVCNNLKQHITRLRCNRKHSRPRNANENVHETRVHLTLKLHVCSVHHNVTKRCSQPPHEHPSGRHYRAPTRRIVVDLHFAIWRLHKSGREIYTKPPSTISSTNFITTLYLAPKANRIKYASVLCANLRSQPAGQICQLFVSASYYAPTTSRVSLLVCRCFVYLSHYLDLQLCLTFEGKRTAQSAWISYASLRSRTTAQICRMFVFVFF